MLTEASALCLHPAPGLRAGQTNVNSEAVIFNFRGRTYPVDVSSGYALQATSGNENFCIRYEVSNNAEKQIDLLYWPLAGNLQIEKIPPHARPSIATTTPPGRAPIIGETWIYAFLSEAVRTFAYQQNKHSTRFAPSASGVGFAALPDTRRQVVPIAAKVHGPQIAQIDGYRRYDLKEARVFPEVGSEFSDQEVEVSAFSFASWDGKGYSIHTKIVRSSPVVKEVRAPFSFALWKERSPSAVLGRFIEFKTSKAPLPLSDNAFNGDFETNQPAGTLYVIEQPITFVGPYGQVCFSAAVYSPIPVPRDLLSCTIFGG